MSPFAQSINRFRGAVASGFPHAIGDGRLVVSWAAGAPPLIALPPARFYRVTALANPDTAAEAVLTILVATDITGISATGATLILPPSPGVEGFGDAPLGEGAAIRVRLTRQGYEDHSTAINGLEALVQPAIGPDGSITPASVATLPAADATQRGKILRVAGGIGVADEWWACSKLADDTYRWQLLELGQS